MEEKYRVVCKACNHVLGIFDTPDVEYPDKCDKCGEVRVGVERFVSDEIEDLNFDILITNKKTNVSKRCGFIIPKKKIEKNRKNLNKMKALMATEIAEAISMIVTPDVLFVELIKQNEDKYI